MKYFTLTFIFIYLTIFEGLSQNVGMNLLTQNSSEVNVGETVYLEVTISNTSSSSTVGTYRLRPQITVPASVVIPATGHVLPSGWTILNGLSGQPATLPGQVVRLSNGTATLAPNTSVTILIALQGVSVAPSTVINGALQFSNGVAPGTGNGTLAGNSTADDNPTATVTVLNNLPLILSNFSASIRNCTPQLQWSTEQEINTNRFEIERSDVNLQNNNWVKVGVVNASGNSSIRLNYSFTDIMLDNSTSKQLYRLKMIDNDQTFKYSNVIVVGNNCNKLQTIIYPNPSSKMINVSINGFGNGIIGEVLDVKGKSIKKINLVNGTNQIEIHNIASGTYLLLIRDKSGKSTESKLIIQN